MDNDKLNLLYALRAANEQPIRSHAEWLQNKSMELGRYGHLVTSEKIQDASHIANSVWQVELTELGRMTLLELEASEHTHTMP